MAVSPGDESAQQPRGIGQGIFGDDVNTRQRAEFAAALFAAFPAVGDFLRVVRAILVRFAINDRQVAEEQFVPGRGPLDVERAFNFKPAKDDAGLAVFFGERIVPALGAGAGAEEPGRVGPDGFSRLEPRVKLVHARFGFGIEIAELAQDMRRQLRGDRHRFITMPAREIVKIGNIPVFVRAGADPDGTGIDAELVMPRHRRVEFIELRFDGFVSARDKADAFQFAHGGIGSADGDGRGFVAHFGLRLETEHGEGGALDAALVGGGASHHAGETALLACVIAMRFRVRRFDLRRHRLAQGVIRRGEIARHLHVRDVQRVADFVEAFGFAVFGQGIADLQPWRVEQIAQRIFILVTVQAAARGAAIGGEARALGGDQRAGQRPGEVCDFGGVRAGFIFGRHLAIADAVVDQHPFIEIGRGCRD